MWQPTIWFLLGHHMNQGPPSSGQSSSPPPRLPRARPQGYYPTERCCMTMPLFAHMAPLCRPGSQWRGRGRQRTRQLTVAQPMFVPASRMDRQLFATHPMFVAASGMDRQPLPFAPDSPFAGCERQLPQQRQISPGGWWGQGRTLVWVWMEECQFSVQFVSKMHKLHTNATKSTETKQRKEVHLNESYPGRMHRWR